jgi:hypothetical protein
MLFEGSPVARRNYVHTTLGSIHNHKTLVLATSVVYPGPEAHRYSVRSAAAGSTRLVRRAGEVGGENRCRRQNGQDDGRAGEHIEAGVFDSVAEKEGKIYIFEAKGGKGWFNPAARKAGRMVTDPITDVTEFYLQGTRGYVRDVAQAMARNTDSDIRKVGVKILDKIDNELWEEIEYRFISSKWSVRSLYRELGPIGKGSVGRITPVIRVTRTIL